MAGLLSQCAGGDSATGGFFYVGSGSGARHSDLVTFVHSDEFCCGCAASCFLKDVLVIGGHGATRLAGDCAQELFVFADAGLLGLRVAVNVHVHLYRRTCT